MVVKSRQNVPGWFNLTRLCVAARQRQTSEAAMNFAGIKLPGQSDDVVGRPSLIGLRYAWTRQARRDRTSWRTALILETEAALPAGEQRFSANRKVFVEHVAAQNPIGTEMAKIVAQLAPGVDQCSFGEISDRERPDRALGTGAFLVAVSDAQLALAADRSPNRRKIGDGRSWRTMA